MRERLEDLVLAHPAATGIIVAALAGWTGYSAYRIGFTLGGFRMMNGGAARAASEALGG